MDFDGTINRELQLGLGLSLHDQYSAENCMKKKVKNPSKCKNKLHPSLSLGPDEVNNNCNQPAASKTESDDQYLESSFSNSSSMIMRETNQEVLGGDEFEIDVEKVTTRRMGGYVDKDGNPRKKLRLTKEQSAVLEENFKEHSTLNPKQKQALAKSLNLLARQVEVWFQNRRARTKLKQTESDCEILKKCCETLTEENKNLQKELEELKSMQTVKATTPFYMQIPAATLTLCPSCERICGGGNSNDSTPTTTFGSKTHHHYYKNSYPFPHPSFMHSMLGS